MEFTKRHIRMIKREERKKYRDKFWYYMKSGMSYHEADKRARWNLS